jgi:hypothetical protein
LRAARCRELPRLAADPNDREEYLAMEKSWLRLADSYQFSEQLNLFVTSRGRRRQFD